MSKILIVGGVAGGATTAARLRRLDEQAQIIFFERGEHISFANCGLPYYVGNTISDRNDLFLQTPAGFKTRYNIDVRVQNEVLSIDRIQKTVQVKDLSSSTVYTESYDTLVLSPGAQAIKPAVGAVDSERVFTLRDIADADRIHDFIEKHAPSSAIIAGGGFIGLEMAENLVQAGLTVSIVQSANQVLTSLDYDMACDVHRYLREQGVTLYLENRLQNIAKSGEQLTVQLKSTELTADMLILAVGVQPNSQLAREAGLAIGERGGIVVDKHMRTSDPHIYAVGDAVEVPDLVTGQLVLVALAGPANKQARIAADNICGITSSYAGSLGSQIIKVFNMTVAQTGVNEKTAQRLALNYDKVFLWLPGHASYYPGTAQMSMKVMFERDSGRIIGAQIVGFDGVDKRCDVLAVAIRAQMTAADLAQLELAYAPPFSSAKDPVNMAGFMIENVLSGAVKNYHWSDVDSLPRDGSVTLLDVRNPQEVARGQIEGFINIPLDTLRQNIDGLEPNKPVYVHCQSGLRSYIAARILSQHGFEVYNLSGGYRLYNAVKNG